MYASFPSFASSATRSSASEAGTARSVVAAHAKTCAELLMYATITTTITISITT